MRYLLLTSLALLLNACATYDFVPTPVPEQISKIIYTTSDSAGNNTWQVDNDTLQVRYMRLSNSGKVIAQRVTKATPNDFNIIATGLEEADFLEASSEQSSGNVNAREKLVVVANSGTRTFTQNDTTKFPAKVQEVTQVIPQLF